MHEADCSGRLRMAAGPATVQSQRESATRSVQATRDVNPLSSRGLTRRVQPHFEPGPSSSTLETVTLSWTRPSGTIRDSLSAIPPRQHASGFS